MTVPLHLTVYNVICVRDACLRLLYDGFIYNERNPSPNNNDTIIIINIRRHHNFFHVTVAYNIIIEIPF